MLTSTTRGLTQFSQKFYWIKNIRDALARAVYYEGVWEKVLPFWLFFVVAKSRTFERIIFSKKINSRKIYSYKNKVVVYIIKFPAVFFSPQEIRFSSKAPSLAVMFHFRILMRWNSYFISLARYIKTWGYDRKNNKKNQFFLPFHFWTVYRFERL